MKFLKLLKNNPARIRNRNERRKRRRGLEMKMFNCY